MNDSLHNLLKQADETGASPPPRAVPGLPQRVYRRHRRKQIARSGVLAALLLSVALGGLLLQRIDVPELAQLEPTTQPDQTELGPDIQLVALGADADLHARTADLLRARERRRDVMERSQASLARVDPTVLIRREKNQFALARVSEADRLSDHPDRADDAIRIYRQTIELFPDTPAADIAASRLEHIPKT
jgi:hypothetical protein